MLIGYTHVSKADGSQTIDLQSDDLLADDSKHEHIYQDYASAKILLNRINLQNLQNL